jgi:carboxypeptidase D
MRTMNAVDQPAGTGFSYVTKQDNVRELAEAADQVVTFLSNLYQVFPEFISMDVRSELFPWTTRAVGELADADLLPPRPTSQERATRVSMTPSSSFLRADRASPGQYIPYIARAILDSTLVQTPLRGLIIGNGWISPREQYPAYLDYALERGLVKKGSQSHKDIAVAVAKCTEDISAMDKKDPTSKGMVLLGVCENILGAISAATKKECVVSLLPSQLRN